MAYADLNTIHNPSAGGIPPASWGDQVRDNLEFLIDPPACSVYHNTTQSVSNDTITAMSANSENYDNNSMHSTSSNTSRVTIQTAGRYQFTGTLKFAANATGNRYLQFRKNGSTIYSGLGGINSGAEIQLSATRSLVLSVGDYIEVMGYQNSGGSLAVTLEEFFVYFITR